MVQGIENHIKKSGAEFTVEFIEPDKQKDLVLPYNLSVIRISTGNFIREV